MKQAMSDAELESASGGTLVLATMGVVVGGAITGTNMGVQTAVEATIDAANS